MLISNNAYAKGDIVAFKLVNGDEILGEFTEYSTAGWMLKKPCAIVPSPQGIGLVQYMFVGGMDKPMELQQQHVMMHAESIPEIRAHYIKTTTGIDTPPQSKIIR